MLGVHGHNQPKSLEVNFSSNSHDEQSIKDIIETLKTFSVNSREYFSQVIILLNISLVMPATNAVRERSVLNLRRIKDWLRPLMIQKRLNCCMILSVHKERADNIDLLVVENDFCSGKEEQWNTFGNFQQKDFPAVKDVS